MPSDRPEPAPADDEARLGYAEALAELEAILAELDGDAIDVDVLATKVQRAASLIETCRARIESARMDVARVVAAMAPPVRPAVLKGDESRVSDDVRNSD